MARYPQITPDNVYDMEYQLLQDLVNIMEVQANGA